MLEIRVTNTSHWGLKFSVTYNIRSLRHKSSTQKGKCVFTPLPMTAKFNADLRTSQMPSILSVFCTKTKFSEAKFHHLTRVDVTPSSNGGFSYQQLPICGYRKERTDRSNYVTRGGTSYPLKKQNTIQAIELWFIGTLLNFERFVFQLRRTSSATIRPWE